MLNEEPVPRETLRPLDRGLPVAAPCDDVIPSTAASKLAGVLVITAKLNPFTASAEPAQTIETVLSTCRLHTLQLRRRVSCLPSAAASWSLRLAMALTLASRSSADWLQALAADWTSPAPPHRGLCAIDVVVACATDTFCASVPVACLSVGSARSTGFALLLLDIDISSFLERTHGGAGRPGPTIAIVRPL